MRSFGTVKTWTYPVSGIRPAALLLESDPSLREALARALTTSGYDITLAASVDEAQRLMRERSFDRIYSDGTLPVSQATGQQEASAGPRVEDGGDGIARVQIDQELPWSVAIELMDVLSDHAPDKPRRLS